MPSSEIRDRLVAAGVLLMAGRAGLLLRFLLAGVAFAMVALLLRRLEPKARVWGQVTASLALLAILTTAPLATMLGGHAIALFWLVERAPLGRMRATVVTAFVTLQVIGPLFLLEWMPTYVGKTREFVVFATNLTLLRSWAYAYDRLVRPEPEPPPLRDYAHYMFFFPAFVNGPFVSLEDFRRRRLPSYWSEHTTAVDWSGVSRILIGLSAVAVALALAPLLEAHGYQSAAHGGVAHAWVHALAIYFAVYAGFSAWTEIEIGLARLSGIALPENFAAPTRAYGIADFWRRWNVTLGHWLRSYVYLPLGGAMPRRRSGERVLEWRNTAAVFGVMVGYHVLGGMKLFGATSLPLRAYLPWVVWGTMNAVGVLATRQVGRPSVNRVTRVVAVTLTVAFAAAGLMTAFFPPTLPLSDLAAIWRRLFLLG